MTSVEVRGGATAHEIAAVLAVLRGLRSERPADPSDHWRTTRLAALKRDQREAGCVTGS